MKILARLVAWCLVVAPWAASLYFHYWLDQSGTWAPNQPYRGLASVIMLGAGMIVSFLAHQHLYLRSKK